MTSRKARATLGMHTACILHAGCIQSYAACIRSSTPCILRHWRRDAV